MINGWIATGDEATGVSWPMCDGETVYLGINSAGYKCAFNSLRRVNNVLVCTYRAAEDEVELMSGLKWWRPFPQLTE